MGSKKKNEKLNRSKDDKKKIITDSRFSSLHSDPRFQNVPKHKTKVEIDSRFDRMFVDKGFNSSSAPVDKRGRRKKDKSENQLHHYYKIEEKNEKDEEKSNVVEDKEEEEEDDIDCDLKVEKKNPNRELEESMSDEDDDAEIGGSDYCTTDTDEDDEIFDDETSESPVDNIPEIEKETHRLAVVNLDWRHVKAVDLYVVLSSFLPKGGQILSVAVYPSEFGLQRMKEEELHGPIGLFDDEQEEESDEEDDEEIDNEKLRAYELSRLRYYYAVVECDSIATADYLYKTCDGVEFERSSNMLDLRFIPDSMEFKHPPRDISTEAPSSYDVLNFHTAALQHSKIHLSWDEDEPQRVNALKRKFNADQLADLEFKEFLASDESESDDGSEEDEDQSEKKSKKGDKYRALLQSDEDGEEDAGQDMEVTFNTGLEDISKRILEKKDKKSETLWEAHLRKRREKKANAKNKSTHSSDDESSDTDREVGEEADDFFIEDPPVKQSKKDRKKKVNDREHDGKDGKAEAEAASRAELELLLANDEGNNTGIKGYNLKHKKKRSKEDMAEDKLPAVDYDDPRFSALFTSPHLALDPTDPQFKRSAAYLRQVAVKQQKVESEYGKSSAKQLAASGEDKANELTKSEYGKSSAKQLAASGEDEANDESTKSEYGKSFANQLAASGEDEANDNSMKKYELSSLVKSLKMKSKQQPQFQLAGSTMPDEDKKMKLRATINKLDKKKKRKTEGVEEELQPELQPSPTMNKSGKKKRRKMKSNVD